MPKKQLTPSNNNEQTAASSSSSSSTSIATAPPEVEHQRSDDKSLPSADSSMTLHQPAFCNNLKTLQQYLNKPGIDVNARDERGVTALCIAAFEGHHEIVDCLLHNRADADATVTNGLTALHVAAEQGHHTVVDLLLHNGANKDAKMHDGRTALYIAARQGHHTVVDLLLHNGANKDAKMHDGRTALYIAARQGHLEVVRLLGGDGKHINTATTDGWTPLHIAAEQGHHTVVDLLLHNGANKDAKMPDGRTALYIAARQGHLEVVRLLGGDGVHINTATTDGWTPLHVAAEQGHTAVVAWLLDNGANKDAKMPDGQTALYIAARQGHLEVVRLLGGDGKHINTATTDGWTPLHVAAEQGHHTVVDLLLHNGANKDAKMPDGRTALYIAARQGHLEVVRLLLNKGANMDIGFAHPPSGTFIERNRNGAERAYFRCGWGPLYAAAKEGHLEVVKMLIRAGANLYANEILGKPPNALEMAIQQYYLAVASSDPAINGKAKVYQDIISEFFLGGYDVRPGISTIIDVEIARRGQFNRENDKKYVSISPVLSLKALAYGAALFSETACAPLIRLNCPRMVMPLFYDPHGVAHHEVLKEPERAVEKLMGYQPHTLHHWFRGAGKDAEGIELLLRTRLHELQARSREQKVREIARLQAEVARLHEASRVAQPLCEGPQQSGIRMIGPSVSLCSSSTVFASSSSACSSSSRSHIDDETATVLVDDRQTSKHERTDDAPREKDGLKKHCR